MIMMKSIVAISAAVTLAATAWLLQPIHGQQAAAQAAPLHIHAIDIDVVPGQIDTYLAALKENGAASVKEPGCREFDITVSQKDPNHVFVFEVYEDAAAAQAHRDTEHFKKYAAATKDMVAKREVRPLASVAMNIKRM
jgi:autoinducer 2-degrading protein